MDAFDIRLEKKNAILKHRRRCKIANLLRFFEVCVVLILISRFTVQFPVAVKNSGGYFRDLTVALVSPRFVFVVGNLIVITLFAKSGHFSGGDSNGKRSGNDLYEEFLERSEKSQAAIDRYETEYREKQRKTEETEYRKKRSNSEESTNNITIWRETKDYRRCQSENMKRDKSYQRLRRSETEKYPKLNDSDEKTVKNSYPEDNMSSEEFRYTIEAFIERQKRFRMDEEYSVFE
ncbi:hypothetical protein SLE2022_043570 [Rubroshorea leprosula]